MKTFAAVMTGKGTGAIATIQICGESAKGIVEKIFRPAAELQTGKIHIGKIADNSKTIDQITIGCISPDTFVINCHGNPLIVELICQLLQREGVELVTAEQLLARTDTSGDTIAMEAKLALPKIKTIEGTQIILNQTNSGLTAVAKKWLISVQRSADSGQKELNAELYKLLADQARKIIETSQIAKLIMYGCKMVLAGPPNTGKSTLLNVLVGREKAIVTNIRGTTRDWVSAECKIGTMAVELIDTAGLDETILNDTDKAAQQGAIDIINQADLILLVLDNGETIEQLTSRLTEIVEGKKILTIINKSDLPGLLDITKLQGKLVSNVVKISALSGTGINELAEKVSEIAGVKNFDTNQAVCFTSRQEGLLKKIAEAKSKETAQSLITELLSGPADV
jgi:tRNA modification GTPase